MHTLGIKVRLLIAVFLVGISSASIASTSLANDWRIRTIAGSDRGFPEDPKEPIKLIKLGMAGSSSKSLRVASPQGVAVDKSGNIYYSDGLLHSITQIKLDGEHAWLTIVPPVRRGGEFENGGFEDDCPAGQARLHKPNMISLTEDGRLIVADLIN